MKTLYLDTDDKLLELHNLSGQTRFGLDTEFVREKTYYPILSLVQLYSNDTIYFVDTLTIGDLSPLCELLLNPNIEKIVHSLYQDIEIISNYCHKKPTRIFDTQLAAAFLGFELQISYKELVSQKLGIVLDKTETRSNWERRPLSEQQLNYAKEDVIYLPRLQDLLVEELHKSNKYNWFVEEIHNQLSIEDNNYCKQILAKEMRMTTQQLASFQTLLEWREKKARHKNLPRQWIMNNQCLRKITLQDNLSYEIIQTLKDEPKYIRYTDEILDLLDKVETTQASPLQLRQPTRPSHQINMKVKKMQTIVAHIAKEHNINPLLIATKKQLTAIASERINPNILSGWRTCFINKLFD